MNQELVQFSFYDGDVESQVRTSVDDDGEVWFVAKDVCDVLGLADVTSALRGLDDDEKLLRKISGSDQSRVLNVINESGLYKLAFRSNKPAAKRFTRWVAHEVLPQIRQTGQYSTNTTPTNVAVNEISRQQRIPIAEFEIAKRIIDVALSDPYDTTNGMRRAVALDALFEHYTGFSPLVESNVVDRMILWDLQSDLRRESYPQFRQPPAPTSQTGFSSFHQDFNPPL